MKSNEDYEVVAKSFDVLKDELKKVTGVELVNLPNEGGIQYGITETLDVIIAGVKTANAVILTLKDGKVTIADVPYFISPLMALPKAISGIQLVPAELENLDEGELNQIVEVVKTSLDVSDEKAHRIIEKALRIAYSIYDLIKELKS